MKLLAFLATLLLPVQAYAMAPKVEEPTTAGQLRPVPSSLNVSEHVAPRPLPKSAAPDVVGAFRFVCGPGHLAYDDPIVYPGQSGKAHLHQFFGNLGADANSTYASLRRGGESTCQNDMNRSSYWVPALLDGKGNAVRPDQIVNYYKRRPYDDPRCFIEASGGCKPFPRGMRAIYGWDQTRPNVPQPENAKTFQFRCIKPGGAAKAGRTFEAPMSVCEPGDKFYISIGSPPCWDGVNLDSPDHRSHLAEKEFGQHTDWKPKCPTTHPYLIPEVTFTLQYTVGDGDDPKLWHLASDHMLPADLRKPGASFHADLFEAWEDAIRDRWHGGCIDKMLNCSSGDLGDGWALTRGPHYPKGQANPRLVPVPARHVH